MNIIKLITLLNLLVAITNIQAMNTYEFEVDPDGFILPEPVNNSSNKASAEKPKPFTSRILSERYANLASKLTTHEAASAPINKKELVAYMKHQLYKSLVQEMPLLVSDQHWMDIAQGDADLAKELNELYRSKSVEEAQQKLDVLCKNWNLESVKIGE